MYYPAQTSLIPVSVALARFVEGHGLTTATYPYWYLGAPLHFLTGPVTPGLLVLLHKAIPSLSYFDWSYWLLFVSFVGGAVGWGMLVFRLSGSRIKGWLSAGLFFFLPWKWLFALTMAETSYVIGLNLTPWVLLAMWIYLVQKQVRWLIVSIFMNWLFLLVNTSVLPSLLVGVSGLVLTAALGMGKGKTRWLVRARKIGFRLAGIILAALCLTVFWYPVSYWKTVILNPSIGGASIPVIVWRLFDQSRIIIPAILAVAVVNFFPKRLTRGDVFAWTWGLTFAFLAVFRFLANPYFWQDYSSWFFEFEVGGALLIASVGWRWGSGIAVLSLAATLFFYNILGRPALISTRPPQTIESLGVLERMAGKKRVFLSGSGVFWANAFFDLNQVRGGRDEAATNPIWREGSYEIREGSSPESTKKWLDDLGVAYVLVHTEGSAEYYHDFKNLDKWPKVGEKVYAKNGDVIYRISGD